MGDFTGFTINGVHSSDLGITRVSDGDRYDETLLPDIEDKTIDIPGNDGSYYYGSYYKPKEFKINVAFDHLIEEQLRKIQQLASNRNMFDLFFDEAPYKVYTVKANNPPEFHYICFDEEIRDIEGNNLGVAKLLDKYKVNGAHDEWLEPEEAALLNDLPETISYRRIYKGEGDLSFIAYDPFAYSTYKTLADYRDSTKGNCKNVDEWATASRMLESLGDYDSYDANGSKIKVYNPGDLPASFLLYIPFISSSIASFSMTLKRDVGNSTETVDGAQMSLNTITRLSNGSNTADTGVMINTRNHLIEGVIKDGTSYRTTGTLYNQYIAGGDFFKINSSNNISSAFSGNITFSRTFNTSYKPIIIYHYTYF